MNYLQQRMQHILNDRPIKQKQKKPINKISPKRQQQLKQIKEAGGDNAMDAFFAAMRNKMTGRCLFCNGKTQKSDDETFHFSIAHLLAKRPANTGGFPSVATCESNWIELCFYGNSCHKRFDDGLISWDFIHDSAEWNIIKEKLLDVLPLVAEEERKNKLYSKLINLVYEKR